MSSETESTGMIDLLAWYETNKQKVAGAGVVLLVVGFFGYFANWKTTQTELNASKDLFEVRLAMGKAEADSPDPSKLLTVASAHSGTASGGRAVLFAAQAYFEKGQYEEAQKQFEAFLAGYGDHPLRGTAMYGVAACKDGLGQTTEAVDGYRRVASSYANSYLAFQAKLAMGGLYESQGEASQALAVYDELSHSTVPMSFSTEAGTRREALLKKHPELAPAEEATLEASE